MLVRSISPRILCALLMLGMASASLFAASPSKKRITTKKVPVAKSSALAKKAQPVKRSTVSAVAGHKARMAASRHLPVRNVSQSRYRRIFINPWKEPTYADSTLGDFIDGEDLTVRRAAAEALGPLNGSVVVADPQTGRILTMVNQRVALKSGFQPCSTIKIVAALAGLSEGIINRETRVRLSARSTMTLTDALAHSNNPYFAHIGENLGFERVNYYARLYGLGEKAGLNVDGEESGTLPASTPGEGLGMMTSFGSGISLTPLQLTALMSAIANGGTLYYLQYPRTQQEAEQLVPRVKRQLNIASYIPDIRPGMEGAVDFGTARRASWVSDQRLMGKTGTCTDSRSPTHLGWFGSYNETGKNRLVVVVLLTGGFGVSGSAASGVAGLVYKNLDSVNYFEQDHLTSPVTLMSVQPCCGVKTE